MWGRRALALEGEAISFKISAHKHSVVTVKGERRGGRISLWGEVPVFPLLYQTLITPTFSI